MNSVDIKGVVVKDYDVASEYPGAVIEETQRLRWADNTVSTGPLVVFAVKDVVITSAFTAIDPHAKRYFLNQTYADVQHFFGLAPKLDGDKFHFQGETNVWEGPIVVIGGPIDGVWHHWLIQWAARLSVLKRLRPDLIENPGVRFLIDYRAYNEPFRSILTGFGIPDNRLALIDISVNHQLPDGYLISFLDQNFYFPEIMADFVDQVRVGLNLPVDPSAPKIRLFCSRQGFDSPKRRVANFDEIEPILKQHGFTIVELGKLTAREQFNLFTQAEMVMGVHGADLAGLLFCQPGARVVIMENHRNLATGLAGTYRALADLRGLSHATMVVDEVVEAGVNYDDFGPQHNRDYVIDPEHLRWELSALGAA